MTEPTAVESPAGELRRAFDLSFASPPPAPQEVEDLLALRVAGDPYAVRLRDVAGLVAGRKVVSVPAVTRDLLGVAGIRGGVVAVFGLASILGYAPSSGAPRWLLLCGAEAPIALAFSEFEGHLRLPKSALHADLTHRAPRHFAAEVASTGSGARPVLDLPLVLARIRNHGSPDNRTPHEEA